MFEWVQFFHMYMYILLMFVKLCKGWNVLIASLDEACNCLYSMIIVNLYFNSCGDSMCTIAASTTFPEPFITPTDRKRLGWVHKSLAGNRFSDHVALLNAFNLWEEAR